MTEKEPKPDETLARAIFTAAAARAIADEESGVDFEGMAEYAFKAATAYAKVQREKAPRPFTAMLDPGVR